MAQRHLELHLAIATVISLLALVHSVTDPKDGTLFYIMLNILDKNHYWSTFLNDWDWKHCEIDRTFAKSLQTIVQCVRL
jgi:hypothetical protein